MKSQLTFNIHEVAKIIGVVPATIRNWEKNGFFSAKRKENNYRFFTLDDIDLMKQIKELSVEKKMSSQAIKEIMTTRLSVGENTIINRENDNPDFLLSYKWREKRDELGYTLENVSDEIGISVSYISKIENGQANVSVDILNKLASFYGENILYFVDRKSDSNKIVRDGEGKVINIGLKGVLIESLANTNENLLFPVIYNIEPNSGSKERHSHSGEEFLYVLDGKLEITLDDTEKYVLKKNDSLMFKSSIFHQWKNIDKKTTRILWIHSPITKGI